MMAVLEGLGQATANDMRERKAVHRAAPGQG